MYPKYLERVLRLPKFVSKFNAPEDIVKAQLKSQLAITLQRERYHEYLVRHNSFFLFEWKVDQDRLNDKEYCWQKFCDSTHKCVEKSSIQPIFFRKPINQIAFDNVLGTGLAHSKIFYCSIQSSTSLESVQGLTDYIGMSNAPESPFKLSMVGLKLDNAENALFYIPSLLDQSSNMYKDLSYDKLLDIAKEAPLREKDDTRNTVKNLLVTLGKRGLSRPHRLRDEWLIFSDK